jgi:hypothetical protein
MPVRKITNRGYKKRVSKFPSVRLKKIVVCESPLELDFVYLLEYSGAKYEGQPLKIRFYAGGKMLTYTPDFFVTIKDRKLLVEVKPASKVGQEKYQTLFRIVSQICRREGYEFFVITDLTIRIQPRLRNIKLLYRYATLPLQPEHQLCANELLVRGECSIAELVNALLDKGVEGAKSVVYALIYWRHLETDLMKPISPSCIVRLPGSSRSILEG